MGKDFVLRGGVLVDGRSEGTPTDLLIENGKIAARMRPGAQAPEGMPEQDARGLHVFPGLIDAHIHFGFAEKITEYETETIYAAQGGVSTVIGYFLNNEDYAEVFDREQGYARDRAFVDYAFHFCTAKPQHIEKLGEYISKYGVTSFKYFMNFKGEAGRYLGLDGTDDSYLYELMEAAAKFQNTIVVCHTENIEIVNHLRRAFQSDGEGTLKDWSASKPPFTEAENCIRAMYFAERLGANVYIPHVSSKLALDEIRTWRERYGSVYAETCPHYLTHTQDSDVGSIGKANPPFRTAEDVEALWEGLHDGTIDVVASDHVPRKRATKEKPIWLASQGFPGTATILPVLLHEGYHKRQLSLRRIAELLTSAPARIFSLDSRKGTLDVGADADITLVDLDKVRTVKASELGSYSDYSLYDGQALRGWPVQTIVRGQTVMKDGAIVGSAGYGEYLPRQGSK